MKYTTINLGENKIEIFNSLLGKEIIKVNNEIVSNKYSILGAEHNFSITENENEVKCKIDIGFSINGVVFDLYKDNKPIIVSPKNGCVGALIVVFIIAVLIPILGKLIEKMF